MYFYLHEHPEPFGLICDVMIMCDRSVMCEIMMRHIVTCDTWYLVYNDVSYYLILFMRHSGTALFVSDYTAVVSHELFMLAIKCIPYPYVRVRAVTSHRL